MPIAQWLLAPVFIHVALTSWIGTRTVRARIASVMGGETRLKDIATDNRAWPEKVRQLGNNFDNQFDAPMMWYACCALLLATGLADAVTAGLSWVFAGLRIAHSLVHTGRNFVPTRMRLFLAGFGTLGLMWIWFAIRLFITG